MSQEKDEALRAAARAWAEDDPDPRTREDLEAVLEEGDLEELRKGFGAPLEFGTAGLRGVLGFGPARMNHTTVARATAGLARQLMEDVPEATRKGVVVGRDARKCSPEFANTVAEILVGYGFRVSWFPEPVPTPVAAFAGRHLGAAATVVVTASHNPPEYNGYKVFSHRGSQIVRPQDERIHDRMRSAGPTLELPRVPFRDAVESHQISILGEALDMAYLSALEDQCVGSAVPPAQVTCVTTALHGVGHQWVTRALAARGVTTLYPVPEQAQPDGTFPTVRFPNPEEDGALDLAVALAREKDADLILANDPDTDRLCVGVRHPSAPAGYHVLSGNDLGVLIADWLLSQRARSGRLPDRGFVVTTVVSTTMLEAVAKAHGVECLEVLTGFKWIWDKAIALAEEGRQFLFGFEEALGYCVGPAVRDKDGIGAAQVLMELAAHLKADGRTLMDRLEELWCAHGLHMTSQVAVVLPGSAGKARMDEIMAELRAAPCSEIAGARVVRFRDLSGTDADEEGLPRSNVLTWWLDGGERVVLRPSGTEPKLKVYLEARAPVHGPVGLDSARERAQVRLDDLARWARDLVAD